MTTPVVVVGAGGFGREVIDVVEAINREDASAGFELLGVLDDAPTTTNLERLTARGVTYLGTIADWIGSGRQAQYLLAVGSPAVRRKLSDHFERAGRTPGTAIHPRAVFGSMVTVGRGSIICAGAQVTTNVTIGEFVHVNLNTVIGHDSVLGDYVTVNPAVVVCGDCSIGAEVMLGAGSVVLQGLQVGAKSVVGAAACVVKDVGCDLVVKGVPAR